MSSNGPSDKMQRTGIVLSWLSGSAVLGILIFSVAFVRSNAAQGAHASGPLAQFVSGTAPYLGFVTLATEAVALALLVVGITCWPSRVVRSPRWVLSALAIVFVAVAIVAVAYLAAMIATSHV